MASSKSARRSSRRRSSSKSSRKRSSRRSKRKNASKTKSGVRKARDSGGTIPPRHPVRTASAARRAKTKRRISRKSRRAAA